MRFTRFYLSGLLLLSALFVAACSSRLNAPPSSVVTLQEQSLEGPTSDSTQPSDTASDSSPDSVLPESELTESELSESEPAPVAFAEPGIVSQLRDVELLAQAGAVGACDADSVDTPWVCTHESHSPQFSLDIDAGSFARWSLRWETAEDPLVGTETIALTLDHTGNLRPNLYLVEAGGQRIHTSLARYGFGPGRQTVYVPLRELRDEEGNRLDFATVNELQLVFEWDDMAGELTIESIRFESVWEQIVWQEPAEMAAAEEATDTARQRAETLAQQLEVPPGFAVEVVATGLEQMTQLDFTPEGELLVSLQGGRVWWYRDTTGDGQLDTRRLYTTGFTEIVGIAYDPHDGAVWLGGRGQLYRTFDSNGDGVADEFEVRIDGLPWGRHQNNNLTWNPGPDPFTGEPAYSWLYFPLGSTGDLETGGPYNAAVLRFPREGIGQDDLEIVAEGVRNPYQVLFAHVPVDLDDPDGERAWQLFAGENGPDMISEPDEVNHIRWGNHYGFPEQFGALDDPEAEGNPYSGPVYAVANHASANGLAYINNPAWPQEYRTLYLSLFGEVFSPTPVGHTVERIRLTAIQTPDGQLTYRGEADDFVVGLDRPLPLTVDGADNLLVGDYATGNIYRIVYTGPE